MKGVSKKKKFKTHNSVSKRNITKANPSKDGDAKLKGLKHYAMPASCNAIILTLLVKRG